MARAQGIRTEPAIRLGLVLSNALVALAGALFAQSQGSADVTLGVGVIVVGLAAVIGGEALLDPRPWPGPPPPASSVPSCTACWWRWR